MALINTSELRDVKGISNEEKQRIIDFLQKRVPITIMTTGLSAIKKSMTEKKKKYSSDIISSIQLIENFILYSKLSDC